MNFADYSYNGFDYKLHKSKGNVALYSQSLKGIFLGYEVVKAKYRKAQKIFGKEYPAGYYMPKDEDWGEYGWTYKSSQRAEDKFKELTERK